MRYVRRVIAIAGILGLAMSSSAAADTPVVGQGFDGRFGDSRTGVVGAAADAAGLLVDPNRLGTLAAIDAGTLTPDAESRLGAYASTRGYASGTVGCAVHGAIGAIYVAQGTYGEEKIGRVFGDPIAIALYGDSVSGPSGIAMAEIEYLYWQNVLAEDPFSPGGIEGSSVPPAMRDYIQQTFFC